MEFMLVARIESRDSDTVGISSNTKVSGPRPIPLEIFRPVPRAENLSRGTIRTLLFVKVGFPTHDSPRQRTRFTAAAVVNWCLYTDVLL